MSQLHSGVSNVGILGIEIYFPNQYVDQSELEVFDGVSSGKYTIGLGQSKMGFCNDREDINSLCLTVVQRLMEKMGISYTQIGRLEVGTETILDKSKSVKSVLMQLFEQSGNTDVEGVDTTNACYGGTSALFNSIAWIQSQFWDGRYALTVAGDIAVYASGSARPTGGAGAVAMLIGPNAPLAVENVRATHMAHVYDFYKPDLSSEYPTVDGPLSIECYLGALDRCYQLFCKKEEKRVSLFFSFFPSLDRCVSLEHFDYFCFHTPYCKLVQKSLARLHLNDFLRTDQVNEKFVDLADFKDVKLEETYFDRKLEQALMKSSQAAFIKKTQPTLTIANVIGNMYTPSLYGGLISLLINEKVESLLGKRIGMFSYGSGLASSMFSMQLTTDAKLLEHLVSNLNDIRTRLDQRICVSPAEFVNILTKNEETHHKAPYQPTGAIESLHPSAYYLVEVDSMYRRRYARRSLDGTPLPNGNCNSAVSDCPAV